MRRADHRRFALFAGFALGTLLAPAPARAACTISTVGVAFGAYNSLAATPDDGTGTVEAACHPSDQSPIVEFGSGQSGTALARRMSGGTDMLDYNLYTDVNRTIVWGDGTSGSTAVTLTDGIVTSGTRRFSRTIYGRIPAGQQVGEGVYTDTLMVTITF